MTRFLTLTLLVLMVFPVIQAHPETRCIDSDTQFAYALDLLDVRDFETSRLEFKRFIRFFPEDERVQRARFLIGKAWLEGGDPVRALKRFNALIHEGKNDTWTVEAHFMVSRCHMATGNPQLGEITLRNLMAMTPDPRVRDRALNARAWIFMETGLWDRAGDTLHQISDDGKDEFNVGPIQEFLKKTPDIPHKNPKLAGTLSIVPGAGYLYLGRYRDAFASFLVNGGLILAACESFDHDQNALGGVITFVGFGFYAGNIYGSASSAHKYNRQARRDFLSSLKDSLSLSLIPDSNSSLKPALTFMGRF